MNQAIEPRPFRHLKLFVNGVLLHVAVGGQGPALLLLHRWLGSSYSWRKVMPALAEHYTVIVPDARGYGDSAKPDAGYDGLTIKDDLRQLLHALGHRQAFVMGHDMGAPVALLYAAHHPDEVLGVGYFDEPLLGFNLDRFTAFRADNPFVYWWFAFNATPHVAAMLREGKEERMVDHLLTAMVADPRSISAEDKAEVVRGLVATVEGTTIAGAGHLIAEEQPPAVVAEIHAFASRYAGRLVGQASPTGSV